MECLQNAYSFNLIEQGTSKTSELATGLFNPAVLKLFTAVWLAAELIQQLHYNFDRCENMLGRNYRNYLPLLPIFSQ
ncbi:MAG: hypothetical protein ABI045_04920 [Flavobacteriales bacterium]